jgi:3-hydroxy-9,10-secoandrosta-1,3,5(10)-triene-9,17-dione monooxygenase
MPVGDDQDPWLLERSGRLAEVVAATSADAEVARRLTPATVDAMHASGLLGLVTPTSLGGRGLGVEALAACTRTIAHECVASAWTISFLVMHPWLLARIGEAARQELFADGHIPLAPAPLAPTGTITSVPGGHRLTGRWEWATGVHHADWVLVHAVDTTPDVMATSFVLVPIADVTIDDVWHTSGMRATGSDTVVVEDRFVPAHRVIGSTELFLGGEHLEGDGMDGLPVASTLALIAATPALGGAERAVELFQGRIAQRVLAYSMGDRASDQPAAQMRLGAALAALAATRSHWESAIAELGSYAGRGDAPLERRIAWRLAAASIVRSSRQIVSSIGEASGASVYFSSAPFQKIQRDLEVLKGHVIFDWDRTTELAGRLTLGAPVKPTDMI